MELTITIPGEPQSKGRPRFNTKTGNVYTPKTTRRWYNYGNEIERRGGVTSTPRHGRTTLGGRTT